MSNWTEFRAAAPTVAALFERRHAATGRLCMMGTIRKDGYPRISPVEPWIFEGELWLVGMPGTRKFADLLRDPRFTLHTATVDTMVSDGDAKLWGTVSHVEDQARQDRFKQEILRQTGHDFTAEVFDPFLATDILGGSTVEVDGDHLNLTIWREGEPEHVIQKH